MSTDREYEKPGRDRRRKRLANRYRDKRKRRYNRKDQDETPFDRNDFLRGRVDTSENYETA